MEFIHTLIESHNYGECNLIPLSHHLDVAYNPYVMEAVAESIGKNPDDIRKLVILHSGAHSPEVNQSALADNGVTLLLLRGSPLSIKNSLLTFIERLIASADSVGGDDSYYDYYPDGWFIATQVASIVGVDILPYKKQVYDKGLYHDEDAISHGLPLDVPEDQPY